MYVWIYWVIQKAPTQETLEKETVFEFSVANLYELENRVFTDQWSIPYKKEESLGRCLLAATRLADEGDYVTELMPLRLLTISITLVLFTQLS